MNTPGERLKEERLRLGFSQVAFARLGGVEKRTQINYESGKRKPDASYFEGIASAGANVDYILTGTSASLRERLNDVHTATEMARMLTDDPQLVGKYQAELFETMARARTAHAEEETLLEHYRRCAPDDQEQIRGLAKRLAKPPAKTAPKRR